MRNLQHMWQTGLQAKKYALSGEEEKLFDDNSEISYSVKWPQYISTPFYMLHITLLLHSVSPDIVSFLLSSESLRI